MKIVNVVGARPNLMKIAPLMEAYSAQGSFEPLLVGLEQIAVAIDGAQQVLARLRQIAEPITFCGPRKVVPWLREIEARLRKIELERYRQIERRTPARLRSVRRPRSAGWDRTRRRRWGQIQAGVVRTRAGGPG